MKKGINLSLGRKRVNGDLRKFFVVSVGIFLITVVISIGLIIYRLVLKASFEAMDQKEQLINSQLLTLVEKNDKLIETKSRISEIKKIIVNRSPITTRMGIIAETVPGEATINGITGNQKEMELNLESDSLNALNDLVEQKINEVASDKKKRIKKVEMKSFGLNPKTLKYNISLGITFD